MGAAKPCLGFPSRTAAVHHLRSAGLDLTAIARKTGISEKNVISLEHGSSRPRRDSEALGRTVVLPIDVLDALKPHAIRRGISTNRLVRDIIATVVDDEIIDAVLDDGGAA